MQSSCHYICIVIVSIFQFVDSVMIASSFIEMIMNKQFSFMEKIENLVLGLMQLITCVFDKVK